MSEYFPPKVWQPSQNGGKFASINRPVAGATHQKTLPVGKHPLQLYSLGTPNGIKVTILLEELLALGHSGAEYDAWLIDIGQGDQFGSGFIELNPNSKIPVLQDRSNPAEPQRVFESGAILLYLAEKFQCFLGQNAQQRTEILNWLFWQMGSAPFVGGGFGHFYVYAPEKYEYPINRYAMETKRQLDVLDQLLASRSYIAGTEYSIADMAIWPWYGALVLGQLYSSADQNAADFLDVQSYVHLQRWAKQLFERPAVQRGRLVNRNSDDGSTLPERHSAEDFKLLGL